MYKKALYISIDNSDGKQQTLTGAHTTHYTNGAVVHVGKRNVDDIVFQRSGEKLSMEEAEDEISLNEAYGQFKIRKKVSPPPIPYQDDKKDDLLVWCLGYCLGAGMCCWTEMFKSR